MNKLKRIMALAGVILLVGMYLVVLILGLTASPATKNVLMAAIGCTIVIPCLMYGMLLVGRVLGSKNPQGNPEDNTNPKHSSKSSDK